jgi:hypothetical protein
LAAVGRCRPLRAARGVGSPSAATRLCIVTGTPTQWPESKFEATPVAFDVIIVTDLLVDINKQLDIPRC